MGDREVLKRSRYGLETEDCVTGGKADQNLELVQGRL